MKMKSIQFKTKQKSVYSIEFAMILEILWKRMNNINTNREFYSNNTVELFIYTRKVHLNKFPNEELVNDFQKDRPTHE